METVNNESWLEPERLAVLSEKELRLLFHLYWKGEWGTDIARWKYGMFDYEKREMIDAWHNLQRAKDSLSRNPRRAVILKNPFYDPRTE